MHVNALIVSTHTHWWCAACRDDKLMLVVNNCDKRPLLSLKSHLIKSHDKYQPALKRFKQALPLRLHSSLLDFFQLSVFLEPHNLSVFLFSQPQSLLYLMFSCRFWLGLLLSKDNSTPLLPQESEREGGKGWFSLTSPHSHTFISPEGAGCQRGLRKHNLMEPLKNY